MESICLQPLFLRILYISGRIINIVRFVVPIVLIVMIGIDIYKHIINPEDKDGLNKIKTKVIASVVVFLTPTLISVIYDLINQTFINNEYSDMTLCREFANPERIRIIEEELETAELDLYVGEKEKNLNARDRYLASIKLYVKSVEASQGVGEYANHGDVITCGSGSTYNNGLFNAVRTAGYKTRNGVVAAALYLSSHIDVNIPYFWSGGHGHSYKESHENSYIDYDDFGDKFIGISNKWGCDFKMISPGTNMQKPNYNYPFGMDCSGFVNWAILNGGYYTGKGNQTIYVPTNDSVFTSLEGIKVSTVKASNAQGKIKPGDIAFKKGHVGMVVEVRDDKYLVAEEKGAKFGLVVSTLDYGERFTDIVQMDNFYSNYKSNESSWSGFK